MSPCLLRLSGHASTEPGERRRYDREFLLALQFVGASIQKTQGLPCINGVILDKVGGVWLPAVCLLFARHLDIYFKPPGERDPSTTGWPCSTHAVSGEPEEQISQWTSRHGTWHWALASHENQQRRLIFYVFGRMSKQVSCEVVSLDKK